MKDKKAVIEVQMNWIFVMIIGGIILFFFIGVVVKQRSASEEKLVNELIRDVDQYMSGASVAPRGAATLPVPGYDVYFSCDHLQIKNQRTLLESRVVFAPAFIDKDDRQLTVWALLWQMPFDVTNFLYVTGPGVRYVFVYEDSRYDDFYNNFVTDKINKIKPDIVGSERMITFPDEGSYNTRIVMLGDIEPIQIPDFAKNSRTSFVWMPYFDPAEKIPYGDVYFLQWNPTSKEFEESQSVYIGVPSLVGAMFSESVEDYDCAMQKAFQNLYAVSSVFRKKIDLLGGSNVCPAFYGDYDKQLFDEIGSYSSQPEKWQEDIPSLLSKIASIRQRNFLIESQSCPLLY
ncbi:hypothetical protein KY335_04705 [Candidatus Woesearchaeota archaeon]|nr:hypothetical protein [Candidatus Woesearchaeota archaeon]MBW3014508.1 hypothetical protein [Candidatus Woesearchaeota archaeon]